MHFPPNHSDTWSTPNDKLPWLTYSYVPMFSPRLQLTIDFFSPLFFPPMLSLLNRRIDARSSACS